MLSQQLQNIIKQADKEKLAEQLHIWYLEACQRQESGFDFNVSAQKPYEMLSDESKFLDKYIAENLLSHQKQTLDKVLEGVEVAIKDMKKKPSFVSINIPIESNIQKEIYACCLDDILQIIQELRK